MRKLFVALGFVLLLSGQGYAYHEQNYPPILKGRVADGYGKCFIAEVWTMCERFDEPDGTFLVLIYLGGEPAVIKKTYLDGKQTNIWTNEKMLKKYSKSPTDL